MEKSHLDKQEDNYEDLPDLVDSDDEVEGKGSKPLRPPTARLKLTTHPN